MFSTNDFCPCKVNKSALKSADFRFGLRRRLKRSSRLFFHSRFERQGCRGCNRHSATGAAGNLSCNGTKGETGLNRLSWTIRYICLSAMGTSSCNGETDLLPGFVYCQDFVQLKNGWLPPHRILQHLCRPLLHSSPSFTSLFKYEFLPVHVPRLYSWHKTSAPSLGQQPSSRPGNI